MSRVSDSEVKQIIGTNRDTTPFIQTATLIVDEELVSRGLSDERLRQVELYLAAHYVAIAEEKGALVEAETGDARERYGGEFEMGLKSTRYGQQAISLDSSGRLAELAVNTLPAQFRVVNTEPSASSGSY